MHTQYDERPVVVALGGNALQAENHAFHFPALPALCSALAGIADQGLVLTHGNGPQIGMLAEAMDENTLRTLDELGAETEGLLGYLIEQELSAHLDGEAEPVTLLTRIEVDADDESFTTASKPIGPWLDADRAAQLRKNQCWQFLEENGFFRRVVASPRPLRTIQLNSIKTLLSTGNTVICAGGGGIPVIKNSLGHWEGVEAVIDKDLSSALLARELDARLLILATNVDGVYRNWGTGQHEKVDFARTGEINADALPAGSMGAKVRAANEFAEATGSLAVIGALADLPALLSASKGTVISA